MDRAEGLSKRGSGSGGARVGRGQKVAARTHMEGVSRGQEGGPGGAEDTWSTSSSHRSALASGVYSHTRCHWGKVGAALLALATDPVFISMQSKRQSH
ncbi:uncharacterized [Tachysurus ichikawai]